MSIARSSHPRDQAMFEDGLEALIKTIRQATLDLKEDVFQNAALEVATYVQKGFSRQIVVDRLNEAALSVALTILWSNLHKLPKRQALVEGFLDCTALSVMFGPSGCGKTFFALDLAAHVALGRAWRGRAVLQGAVAS